VTFVLFVVKNDLGITDPREGHRMTMQELM